MTLPVVSLCRLSGTVRCGCASGKGFSGDRPCTKWVSATVIDGSSSPSRPRTEASAAQLTWPTLSVLSPPCALLRRYPIFENPYPLTIHESPVTCCEYFADCPVDLIPALYSVGSRQKRQGYSKKVRFTTLERCVVFICDVSVAMGIPIMKLYVNISMLLFTCEEEHTEL